MVYAWGKNDKSQLGRAAGTHVLSPQLVKSLKHVKTICSGGTHSAVVFADGRLLTCGSSLHGKLGISGATTVSVPAFTPLGEFEGRPVHQAACGEFHTLCLLEDGSVFTWGGTLHQKLGQRRDARGPQRIGEVVSLRNQQVTAVDCGDFHSVALTADGRLFAWGGGGQYNKGQCGQGHCNNVEAPALVAFPSQLAVQRVSCGGFHTLALTQTGEVYAWGEGECGQCGTGDFLSSARPKKVAWKTDELAIDVSAGGHHSLSLTQRGQVFAWGYNVVGQLGLKVKKNQGEPRLVEYLATKPVRQIAAGWDHSLILTRRGDVFACGYGKFGQLGLGNCETTVVYTHVAGLSGKNVQTIFAGGHNSWAVVDNDYLPEYSPPSPISFEFCSDSISAISSPPTRRQFFGDFEDTGFTLSVVYSDVAYSHRFVKFALKTDPECVQEYINYEYVKEPGTRHHRLQEEEEEAHYTLLLICDPTANEPPVQPTGLICEETQEVIELGLLDIQRSPVQEALAEWARQFSLKLDSFLQGPPAYFELRPTTFYLPLV